MEKFNIITVINRVSPTSMPLNEFLTYRKDNLEENGSVMTLSKFDKEKHEKFSTLKITSFKEDPKGFVKFIWNNSDMIFHLHQPRAALLVTFISLLIPKKYNRVVTVHNNFDKFKTITKGIIVFNVLFAKRVTFVSESSIESFPKLFRNIFGYKCSAVTNGVDLTRVDNYLKGKSIEKSNNSTIKLVYIGKLHIQKNHDKMLSILSKLPENYRLTIIGDGTERERLEKLIKKLKITDKVTITGIIEREQVYELLRESDIFVSTALWEGMPIGVLESMACFLPVVLSNIPPHVEIQNKSSVNLIFKKEQEFIDKIKEYGCLDCKERMLLGEESRNTVANNFDLKIMHNIYSNLYKNI